VAGGDGRGFGVAVGSAALSPAADLRAIDREVARGRAVFMGIGILALLGVPLFLTIIDKVSYLTASVNGLILGLAAISLVVLVGYVGQVSLAQFAFMGIGALVVSRVAPLTGYWAALPIAGLAAIPVGLIAALPALRLRGIYLAIATLGLSQVIIAAVLVNPTLAGGYTLHLDTPSFFGQPFTATLASRSTLYFIDLAIVAAAAAFTLALRHRKTGLAFTAVRDSELAAASVGINVVKYKLVAFALSAFYAGVAGGLYMALSPETDPRYFDPLTGSVPLLILLVVGGVTSIGGALLASFLFSIMPILLPQLITSGFDHLGVKATFNYHDLVLALFGALLLRGLVTSPSGLVGELDRRLKLRAARRKRPTPPPPVTEEAPA
jgi:branched-chain amino acid transport system permease protein